MPLPRRTVALLAGVFAAGVLAGCGTGAGAKAPDWRAQPSFQGEGPGVQISPAAPVPSPERTAGPIEPAPSGSAPNAAPSRSPAATEDPAVVATGLVAPVGLTLLPDGTALVGERTTGRIVRVQPQPDQPVTTVRTLPGLSTAGGGGLLDLALSPFYSQDGLIYAYLSTATDNRIVAFTLTGPVTTVLSGIPHGTVDNGGRIAFTRAGTLYVATGDATTAHPRGLAGKVLRVTDIGTPASDNPQAGAPTYASGLHVPAGLCVDPATGSVFEVEARPSGDVVNLITAGSTYGWPSPAPTDRQPLAVLPAADSGPGGCAVEDNTLYVTSLDGHALLAAAIDARGSTIGLGRFTASLTDRYGRLRTVVAAPDGALWLTTSNRDGFGQPGPLDERVLRIVPSSARTGGGVM